MANSDLSVPAGWYRPARDFLAEFRKARGREPTAAERKIIAEQVRLICGGMARHEELTFEHHHGVLDFFLKHGRMPTGYPSNDRGENLTLVNQADARVNAHIANYEASHRGILGSIADIFTAPAKAATEKAIKAATGRDVHVTSISVSPKELLDAAQAVISFVPGIGAGVNAAIAAGEALANGENITDALADVAKNALPGGPIAHQAFDAAYKIVKAAAKSENIGDAALAIARDALPGGDVAKKAFDVGLAIAHGQNVQDAVKDGATELVKSQVATLAKAALPVILAKASKLLPPEVTRVATTLHNAPALRALPVEEVAKALHVEPAIVSQAQGALDTVWQKLATLSPAQQKELASWTAANHPDVKSALRRTLLAVKEAAPLTKAELDAKAGWAKIARLVQDSKSADPRVRAMAQKDMKILAVVANTRKNIIAHMAKHGGGIHGVLIDDKGRQVKGRFVHNGGAPESILYTRKGAREGRFVKIA